MNTADAANTGDMGNTEETDSTVTSGSTVTLATGETVDTSVNTALQAVPGGAIVPAQPPAATTSTLAIYQAKPQLFIAREQLKPQETQLAQQMAQHFDVSNTAALISIGNAELAQLGDVSDEMISGQRQGDIPEVGQKMSEVVSAMKSLKQQNFQPDEKVRQQVEKGINFFQRLIGKGKTALEVLMEQFDTIQQMIDKIVAELSGHERDMVENIVFYDKLYQQNDQYLRQLLIVIAALEYKQEWTRNDLQKVVQQQAAAGNKPDPNLEAQARWLSDVVSLLDVKIGDLKSRLMLAWSAGPEISILRAADVGLAMKLSTLVYVAIPTWKETAALYMAALRSQQASAAANIAMDATDAMVEMRANALGQAVGEAARTTERAMISTDALQKQTDAVINAIDDLISTRRTGQDARQVAEAAITQNIAKLQAANQRLSQAAQSAAAPPAQPTITDVTPESSS
jgi:uncharacterized protein YaaN involved in tellurite resistance